MKLINYNYGGPDEFNCWMRGKIVMSANEWRDVQIHLMKSSTIKKLWNLDILRKDMERTVKTKDGFLVSVRTTATDEIVRHFKPVNANRYKRQNYMIHVLAA